MNLRFPMCKFKKSVTLIGEKCNIYALEVPKSKDFCLSELLIAKISNYMHQSALKKYSGQKCLKSGLISTNLFWYVMNGFTN